jgi:hypothetical protein
MPAWTDLAIAAGVGAVGGLHAATWGMYKDSPHEGFAWRTYLRSVWVGMVLGPLVAALFGLSVRSAGELLLLFGATYAAERLAHEFYKTFLRQEDQSKYFIPMAFAVRGRVVRHPGLRIVLGGAYLAGLLAAGLALRAFDAQVLPAAWQAPTGLLLGTAGGWISAFGGAWKDAPHEGFDLRKFFRSPAIALLYALLCTRFTDDVLLVAIAAVGYTIASTETYKTFFFPSVPRGKFAGRPVRFPEMLRLRQHFVPLYVGIWVVLVGTAVAAGAVPVGR